METRADEIIYLNEDGEGVSLQDVIDSLAEDVEFLKDSKTDIISKIKETEIKLKELHDLIENFFEMNNE